MVEGIMRSALCPCFIWLSAVVIISPSPIGAVETKTLVAKMTKIRLKCIVMMFLDCNVVDVVEWEFDAEEQEPGMAGHTYRQTVEYSIPR